MRDPSITSFFYTAFLGLGTSTSNTTSGICVAALNTGTITAQTGSFNFQYNVVREIVTQAATTTANTALQTNNTATGITISNNVFYLLGWTAIVATTILAAINDNNYFMGCLASNQIINASIAGSDNVFTSNNAPALISTFYNNASNNSFYSNSSIGLFLFFSSNGGNFYNFRFWRNGSVGIQFQTASLNREPTLSLNDCYFFGNVGNSISFAGTIRAKLYFNNSFFYGGTTLVQPNHYLNFAPTNLTTDTVYYNNCYFGYSDTSLTSSPFTGGILSNVSTSLYMLFSSCYFNPVENSTGVITGGTNLFGGFRSINHNGLTGSNREWTQSGGLITTDTTIFLSSSKSTRLTPNSTTFKLVSPLVRVPVKSGNTCTISVSVRKTISSDGADYNGDQVRIMYAFNPVLGNFTETVGDTTKNIFLYPQNFENSYWLKTGTTVVQNATNAPDGTLTADQIKPTNTGGEIRTTNVVTAIAGQQYTWSVYVKSAGSQYCSLTAWSNDDPITTFDLINISIVSEGGPAHTSTITDVGNGWRRITITRIINNNFIWFRFYPSTLILNTEGLYLWGTQIVAGPTSLPYYDNGQWEPLTYTTATFSSDGIAEFYVDCTGTAGFINIDDWNTTTSNDSRGQDYWGVNGVYIEPTYRNPTRASGYIN
jgi:hypothetical protein